MDPETKDGIEELGDSRSRSQEDRKSTIVIVVVSVLLLIALGAASLYGLRYGNVDTSVAVGKIQIFKNDTTVLSMRVNEELKAKVYFYNKSMSGTLKLAGAETDTVLFQLTDIEFNNGADASDVVFFIRMPREGLRGDYLGPWMMYFSQPSRNINRSDWFFVQEDGKAIVGTRKNKNALTIQRNTLIEMSSGEWTWKKDGKRITFTSAEQVFLSQMPFFEGPIRTINAVNDNLQEGESNSPEDGGQEDNRDEG